MPAPKTEPEEAVDRVPAERVSSPLPNADPPRDAADAPRTSAEADRRIEELQRQNRDLAAANRRLEAEALSGRAAQEERAQIEEALREVRRLEGLGLLAGGIAHEFNNLLVSILGYADLLQATLEAGSEAREHADEILESARLAAAFCAKLVAYAGRDPVGAQPLDLRSLTAEVADAQRSTPALELDLRPTPEILGDPLQIGRLIESLIENAREATLDADRIVELRTGTADYDEARLRRLELQVGLEAGRCAFVEVIDQGVGMNTQTLEHLFDPFYSTKFLGRGLGLAVVFGTVSRHRGGIEVDSKLDHGTRIRVLFSARGPRRSAPGS